MVCKFPVATNENFQDKGGEWQTRTEWHDIVCWGRLAERAEKTLQKGSLIYVEGRISKRKWQDRDGNDRYTTEVVSNTFKLLERRESSGARTYEQDFPSIEDQFPQAKEPMKSGSADMSTPEADDLPF